MVRVFVLGLRQGFDQGFGIAAGLCAHVDDVKFAPATKGASADLVLFCGADLHASLNLQIGK